MTNLMPGLDLHQGVSGGWLAPLFGWTMQGRGLPPPAVRTVSTILFNGGDKPRPYFITFALMLSRHLWSFILVAALLFWAGLVAGISFLEAPLKFTAPGITVPLGLGIGRLVFQALNKVEIGLAVLAVVAAFRLRVPQNLLLPLGLLAVVLAAQTLWLLPALDVRALALLAGKTPPASNLHYVYIGAEVFKLLLLLGTANRAFVLLSRPAQAWRLRQAN